MLQPAGICRSFFYLLAILLATSCEVINPEVEIPSYLRINDIGLKVADSSANGQGSTAHKITDVWVYLDQQPIGAFELPTTIPLLAEGTHAILIRPGILKDGISTTHIQYPMYQFYDQNVTLNRGKILTIYPEISYFSGVKFEWIEDFEQSGISIEKGSGSDTTIKRTNLPTEVFEGKQSGVVNLDANHPSFECRSANYYPLPKVTDVFLEFNYRCNDKFIVGLYQENSGFPFPMLSVPASPSWNKLYVDLSSIVNIANSTRFKVYFSMKKSESVESPYLFLDNIKLIHK